MKREAKVLLSKALDSLFLAIDHFNRPYDRGRHEAVLMLVDRAFELQLKAAIVHLGGRIRERKTNETIGFDKCVRKCVSDTQVKCLSEEEAFTIQTINSLRDAAQHYVVSLSEQHLYLHAQAGLSLFEKTLQDVFDQRLSDHFPERVLPITTAPPQDMASVITAEFEDIQRLVAPSSRKRMQARAKLRALAIIEASLSGERTQPNESALNKFVRETAEGKDWTQLFPGVASLRLDVTGTGLTVSLRITKSEGEPIRLVDEGTPGATIVGVKRVNELSYYSLGLRELANKAGLTQPKMLAVVKALQLQRDSEFFKTIKIGKALFKRYSPKALMRIQEELPNLDIDEVWRRHGAKARR